jgi:hypothetical protein
MWAGLSLLGAVTAVAMVAVGAQQLTALVGAVAGVQVGVVGIMALAMAIPMRLATMLHLWCTQALQ